jgi:hypothetical protein
MISPENLMHQIRQTTKQLMYVCIVYWPHDEHNSLYRCNLPASRCILSSFFNCIVLQATDQSLPVDILKPLRRLSSFVNTIYIYSSSVAMGSWPFDGPCQGYSSIFLDWVFSFLSFMKLGPLLTKQFWPQLLICNLAFLWHRWFVRS